MYIVKESFSSSELTQKEEFLFIYFPFPLWEKEFEHVYFLRLEKAGDGGRAQRARSHSRLGRGRELRMERDSLWTI